MFRVLQGSAGFNPLSLSPLCWYDFSDAATLFTDAGSTNVSSDGDLIYQCNDKSVNGNTLLSTVSAQRPAYRTAIREGRSVARFDGATTPNADTLYMSQLGLTGDFTVLGVAKSVHTGSQPTSIIGQPDGWWLKPDQQTVDQARFQVYSGGWSTAGSAVSYKSAWHLFVAHRNGATNDLRVDGVVDGTVSQGGACGTTATYTIVGGGAGSIANNGSEYGGPGDIAEILVVSSALDADDLRAAEGYLMNKWGI